MPWTENNWTALLQKIHTYKVIPIIGKEIITVKEDENEITLHDWLCNYLINTYNLQLPGNQKYQLELLTHKIVRQPRDVAELKVELAEKITQLIEEGKINNQSLEKLVKITDFRLFVNTNSDGTLISTLEAEYYRKKSKKQIPCEINYPPSAVAGRLEDVILDKGSTIASLSTLDKRYVFNMFGNIDEHNLLDYTLTDTEIVELVMWMLTNEVFRNSKLNEIIQKSDLLFIGCSFPSWFFKFFARVFCKNLFEFETKKKWLLESIEVADTSRAIFLSNYNVDIISPPDVKGFIGQLYDKWSASYGIPNLSDTSKAFISFAVEDRESVQGLVEKFREYLPLWYDEEKLQHGQGDLRDELRKGIEASKVFIPIVSNKSRMRSTGHFRLEWDYAINIKSRIKIFPIFIDDDCSPMPEGALGIPQDFLTGSGLRLNLNIREINTDRGTFFNRYEINQFVDSLKEVMATQ